jgi:RNA polymerase sigma factor (sigma-70 family)
VAGLPDLPTDGATSAFDVQVAVEFVAGSDDAFDALYRRYAAPIHDFLRWTVRDADAAQDLVQNTFLSAYERRSSLRDPAAVKGWLYRIAHNLAMNHLSRSRPTDTLDDDMPFASTSPLPVEVVATDETVQLVWDAAASLEPRQFAVLDLTLRKGLSSSEVAVALGIDAAAASLAVHRAREALGNAVRFLVVARRRRHCERLAELVPDGVRRLTPEQRASVDRHVRRCSDCQRMATTLTAPGELFAVAPIVALPLALRQPPRPAQPTPPSRPRWRKVAHVVRSPVGVGAVVVAAGVLATVVVVATRHGGGNHAPKPAPVPTASAALPPTTGRFTAADISALPSDAVFTDVACPTARRCYAVATSANGPVLASTSDGARTWVGTTLPGAGLLTAIACADETTCVAGGQSPDQVAAIMFRTVDGEHWSAVPTPSVAPVDVIRCPDTTHCLAIGANPQTHDASVLASRDAGATWAAGALPPAAQGPAYLAGARCLGSEHCWVVGSGIWFTSDLGSTWRDLTPKAPACTSGLCGLVHTLTDVDFTSADDGVVVGYIPGGGYGATQNNSYVARTSDGGTTFTELSVAAVQPMPKAVQILCGDGTCLVVGQTYTLSELVRSADGGASWRAEQRVASFLRALACSPDRRLCVVVGGDGHTGVILSAAGL